jgi:hypothetical protein
LKPKAPRRVTVAQMEHERNETILVKACQPS